MIKKETSQIDFSPEELDKLYFTAQYDTLSQKFISIIKILGKANYIDLKPHEQIFIDVFIGKFLYIFSSPDYIVSPVYAIDFIELNNIISNLTAISCYKNTNEHLEALKKIPPSLNNLTKILTLYSARNTVKFDIHELFDMDCRLASVWYYNYFFVDSFPTLIMNNNISEHIKNIDPRLNFVPFNVGQAYFISTYYDTVNDRKLKQIINGSIKDALKNIKITNKPDRNKIAFITNRWVAGDAVYTTCHDHAMELAKDYDITLIQWDNRATSDIELFKEVIDLKIGYRNNQLAFNLSLIKKNNFSLVWFPDIGLNDESIFLSNLRIAPVQVTTYSHTVSTFGSKIDYFIGGKDVEIARDANQNYFETLLLIPGIGLQCVWPDYEKKNIRNETGNLIIDCPWGIMKLNYDILHDLQTIIKWSDKKIIFRFFGGDACNRFNNYIPLKNELISILGQEHVELIPHTPGQKYMEMLETGDITIASYPSGGYNSLINSLFLGKPVIVREGNKAYNRIDAAVLRRLDLDELISYNRDEYIDKIVNLINDDEYRKLLTSKINNMNLKSLLFRDDEAKYFKKAIDYLIENHDKLQQDNSRNPIIIN